MKENVIPFHRDADRQDLPLSDAAVACACATGDGAAITMLFDRFHHSVARYISRLLGAWDVEDLVQATFLEVLRGNSRYDGRASVTTWLFAIATNIVRHHRRTDRRKLRLVAAMTHEAPPSHADVADRVDVARQLERAEELLAGLGTSQREAFVLCVLEGCSAREAATILGTSEGAVWKRVCKARAAIRDNLREEAP